MIDHLRKLTEIALDKQQQAETAKKIKERENLIKSAKQSIEAQIDNIVQFPYNLELVANKGKTRHHIFRGYTKCAPPNRHYRNDRNYSVFTPKEISEIEEFFKEQVETRLHLVALVIPSCGSIDARNVWWDMYVSWE